MYVVAASYIANIRHAGIMWRFRDDSPLVQSQTKVRVKLELG